MQFAVNAIRQCAGGNHIEIDITLNGGRQITRRCNRSELLDELDDVTQEERALLRIVSAVKEAGASTPVQIRNAILNNTYRV